jgi:Cell Wall Hydrolase
MSYRRFGSCLALSAFMLLPALMARAQADPLRLAALTPADDAAPDGTPFDSALDCLALNIYWEARAEPRLGQIAVAEVTLNRVADPAFPNTVCGVVRQGEERGLNLCQFSWHCDGLDDRPRNLSAWQSSRQLAMLALSGRLADPTGGARWFHSDQVNPSWPELAPVVKIGSHIFYRTAPAEGEATAQRAASPPLPPVRKPSPPVSMTATEEGPDAGRTWQTAAGDRIGG